MNSKWVRVLGYSLAACAVACSVSYTSNAADVTSGVSAISSTKESVDKATASVFAGVSLKVNDLLADATLISTEVELAENEAEKVAQGEYANIAIAKVDNYVYVRSEPSAESEYVGKLYDKSAATVLETVDKEDGTWLKISSGDCSGYVKSEFVIQNDEEYAKSVSRRYATCMTETLYVREQPSVDSAIIDMIPLGDDYTVVDESMVDDGWVKITCDAGEGFVSTEYVSFGIDFTLAESKEAEEARLAKEAAEREAARKAAEKATRAASKSSKSSGGSAGGSSGGSGKSYSAPSGGGGSSVVNYGSQFVGNPYVYGGTSLTNGTDCSGFVMSVYSAYGVSLPHSSSALRSVGTAVDPSQMQPGDIVCYSGHVGIYAGNGTLLHASNKRTGITYSNVNYKPIITARRIF